jgi:outer membrane protein TolC
MQKSSLLLLSLCLLPLGGVRADEAAPASLPDPLDLHGAVVYALDHNYAILQAREQIRQQDGIVVQVKAPGIPNVSATAGYQRNQSSVSESYPLSNAQWQAQVKATQVLFAGGGIHASVRSAELTRDAALFDLQTAIDTALLDVRTRFYNVLLNRERVRVQEENVRLLARQVRDSQSEADAGTISKFDLLRAKVALANAQPDLITARNDYRLSVEQLRQSLGVPRGTQELPAVTGTLAFEPQDFPLDAALASAHEHRPELLRLAKLEEAGEQTVTSARSNYYPNLSVFGAYERVGEGLVQGGSFNANGWLLGVQSSWAIFDGRATAGHVSQTKSQLRQTRLSAAQEELTVNVEVRQALSSLEEAKELVTASQQTSDEAAEALRLANSRFKAGTATQLDVLTSQVALTQARTNQLQANYTHLVAVANVRKAIGLSDALVAP